MSLRSVDLLLLLALIASFITLSACKTPPAPPVQPQITQKPPPTAASSPPRKDVLKQDQKASETDNDTSETRPASESKIPDETVDHGPAEHDNRTSATPAQEAASQTPLSTGVPQEAQTSDEKASDMDRQLQESLSVFDGKLLKQRALLESLEGADAGEAFPEGAVGDVGETGEADANAQGSTNEESRPTASANEDLPDAADGTPGEPERGATQPAVIPPDIPDGRDDDIVARQIREAAMREKDPQLREKLWEEYRRYKQSSGTYSPLESGVQFARHITNAALRSRNA